MIRGVNVFSKVKQTTRKLKPVKALQSPRGTFGRNKNSLKLICLCSHLIMPLLTAQQCNMLLLFKHFDIPYLYTQRRSPWKHVCNNLPPAYYVTMAAIPEYSFSVCPSLVFMTHNLQGKPQFSLYLMMFLPYIFTKT